MGSRRHHGVEGKGGERKEGDRERRSIEEEGGAERCR